MIEEIGMTSTGGRSHSDGGSGDLGRDEEKGRRRGLMQPLRLSGVVVGEDFESGEGVRQLFGGKIIHNAQGIDGSQGYSRMKEGVAEMTSQHSVNIGHNHLKSLNTLADNFQIFNATHLFPYSRKSALLALPPSTSIPAPSPEEVRHLLTLPLAQARDHLIPKPALTPFPIASSWHAGVNVEVLSPQGRVNGVGKDKVTGEWGERSWPRVCRSRMRERGKALKEMMGGKSGNGGAEKGSQGWRVVSKWMEENGPWKGWHSAERWARLAAE